MIDCLFLSPSPCCSSSFISNNILGAAAAAIVVEERQTASSIKLKQSKRARQRLEEFLKRLNHQPLRLDGMRTLLAVPEFLENLRK